MIKGAAWPHAVRVCLWFITLGVATGHAAAQESPKNSFFDGVTAGIGLSVYQGDLDENPLDDPVRFLSAGFLNALAVADGDFGPVIVEFGTHYSRFSVDRLGVDMSQNILSFEAGVSRRLPLLRPDLVRVFVSAGPAMLVPTYRSLPEDTPSLTYKELGTRVVGAFAIGLVVQDRVRFGFRFTSTDYLEGTKGRKNNVDLVSFINVGYRFKLSE